MQSMQCVAPPGLLFSRGLPSTEVLGYCSVAPAARVALPSSMFTPILGTPGNAQGLKPGSFLTCSGTTKVVP